MCRRSHFKDGLLVFHTLSKAHLKAGISVSLMQRCSICLVGEERRTGGQATGAVDPPDSLIEGATVVSPPRLSQPPRSARGKYSNRHHRGECALFATMLFLASAMVGWKEFHALICIYRLWGPTGGITRESVS